MCLRKVAVVGACLIGIAGVSGAVRATGSASTGSAEYHVVKTVPLGGGNEKWDLLTVDGAARRLYITRETHVLVMDADSTKIVGEIPHTDGVHGVALAPQFGRGFTSNGNANTVTIFDLKTLEAIRVVKVDTGPDGIVFDPFSKRVFTINQAGNSTVINAADGSVVGNVSMSSKADSAVPDGKGHLFMTLEATGEILELDTQRLVVLKQWTIPCYRPGWLDMDPSSRRLFVACLNQVMVVVNADDGKTVATAPIGGHIDGVQFDPETHRVLASSKLGVLNVLQEASPDSLSVLEDVRTEPGARTLAIDPKTHNVFLATADFYPPQPGDIRPRVKPNTFRILVVGQ